MAVGVGAIGQMAAVTVQRRAIIGNAVISAGGEAGDLQSSLSLLARMAESVVQQDTDG